MHPDVRLAEWSNATDLRSVLFGGAGSNPARCTFDSCNPKK